MFISTVCWALFTGAEAARPITRSSQYKLAQKHQTGLTRIADRLILVEIISELGGETVRTPAHIIFIQLQWILAPTLWLDGDTA